jgi:hypothetical protein
MWYVQRNEPLDARACFELSRTGIHFPFHRVAVVSRHTLSIRVFDTLTMISVDAQVVPFPSSLTKAATMAMVTELMSLVSK